MTAGIGNIRTTAIVEKDNNKTKKPETNKDKKQKLMEYILTLINQRILQRTSHNTAEPKRCGGPLIFDKRKSNSL